MLKKCFALMLSLLLPLCGCSSGNIDNDKPSNIEKATSNIFAMNTYITMTTYGEKAQVGLKKAESCIKELGSLWSVTDTESEVYAVNHSDGIPQPVSPDTLEITGFALTMAKQTDGAFDPTIYPILKTWGFTTGSYQVPTQAKIETLLKTVGYQKVALSGNKIALLKGMQLDFGAVAKGYAGDKVAALLKEQGITSAMINLGGNVQAIGKKPDGDLWQIGVRAPNKEGHIGVLALADCAVVTSGGYERYFTGDDGQVYWHILDPSTGKPADSGAISVTVVGKEGKLCDALSTALFVMGLEKATEYWRENGGFEMLLLTEENELYLTEGLESAFTLQESYASLPVTVIRS